MPVTKLRSTWVAGSLQFLDSSGGIAAGIAAVSGGTTCALNVLTIPVTHRYVAKTTDSDAEACTLANGTPGQMLTISLVTDGGGDATVTPATCTGFATIVFADVKDTATLLYVDDTIGWVLLGCYGTAAPPVVS